MEKRSGTTKKIALFISWTIHPITSFFILIWSMASYLDVSIADTSLVLSPFLIVTITYVVITVFVLNHADIEYTDVKKRPPLFVAMVVGLFFSLLISKNLVPAFDPFLTRLLIILTFATVITFSWKISIHALFSTMAIVTLIVTISHWFTLLILLLPPLYWSRIYLHKHRYWQLVAGSILSLILLL